MIKRMFGLIKKMFIGLLVSTVNVSNHTKCASLNNQQCMVQSALINLKFNEYSQGLRYYPFAVKWDRLDVWEVVILFMIYLIKYV